MLTILGHGRVALLAGCVVIAAAALLAPGQAAAQFLCTNANTGNAAGATASVGAVACGTGAVANGSNTTVVGRVAGVGSVGPFQDDNSFFGAESGTNVVGGSNSYFGSETGSNVTGGSNSAFGVRAGRDVTGSANVAIGNIAGSIVNGEQNTAIGSAAGRNVTGDFNAGIGHDAGAGVTGSGNVAIGDQAGRDITASNTVSIGTGATAGGNGSVAIGNAAQATRANQVVLGTSDYTYTTPGITSAASRAAQTGTLQIVTSDDGGNLAGRSLAELGLASAGDIAGINSQIAGINARLEDLGTRSSKAFAGVAMAFAMAGTPTVLPNERVAFSFNWGNFQGQNGLALAGAVKLHENIQLNGGIGYGTNQNIVGARAGVRVGW